MGKINKIAVACARFGSNPVLTSNGTAIIPPPPPNRLFAAPTATPHEDNCIFFTISRSIAPPRFSKKRIFFRFFSFYTIYNE
jgi:hypothetical protein